MPGLGAELGEVGRGTETIELRESRSSLAGVIFAAAAEGISIAHFAEQIMPQAHGHAAHAAAAAVAHATRPGLAVVPSSTEPPPVAPAAGSVAPPAGSISAMPVASSNAQQNPVAIELAGGSAPGGMMQGDAAPKALEAVAQAKKMLGEPYVWGGEDPKIGYDCSGLVQWAYRQAGVTSLGRTTWTQAAQGTAVQWGHFKPGDLIFSNWDGGSDPEHVVMYIGDGKVIAAPHTGTDVQIQAVSVFKDHFVNARRIVPATGDGMGAAPAAAPVAAVADHHVVAASGAPVADAAGAMGSSLAGDPETLRAAVAVKIAQSYLGTKYVYGGESPSGFDCSGLMQYVWNKVGVHLDRTSEEQIFNGKAVPRSQLEAGDLVFFRENGDVHHVGMYVGHGRFIEAPHTGDVVKYARLDDPYYAAQYAGARRVSGLAGANAPMPQWAVREVEQMQGGSGGAALAAPAGPGMSSAMPAVQATPGTAQFGAAGMHPVAAAADAHGMGGLGAGEIPYPGDNAPRAKIAEWMAGEARKAGIPPQLPIMAALSESGLRNLQYGDRDSLGFFQMRTSIWERDYPGFEHKPELQLKWFIDHAVAIHKQRLAEGYANYGKDPSQYGNWVGDVEGCAAQYRYRYQEQLDTANSLLNGGA